MTDNDGLAELANSMPPEDRTTLFGAPADGGHHPGFNTIRDAMPTSEQAAAHLSAVVKPLGFPAPTGPLRLRCSGTLTGPVPPTPFG